MARGDASSRGTPSVPAALTLLKELFHASHTRRWISLARSDRFAASAPPRYE